MMSYLERISLTASELGYLWTGYSINEMSKWYLTVFREQSKDEEIKNLYTHALQNTNEILTRRKEILSKQEYPAPVGFSDADIDISSPPLFSDPFLLHYLQCGSRLGLEFHTRSLALATRVDVRNYHLDCLHLAMQLNERVVEIVQKKGVEWNTPTLPNPPFPEYIQKSGYLNGWIGNTRPMNSMEIANLYFIMDVLITMEALCMGFAQTTDSDKVASLFQKGVTVIKNQYKAFAEILKQDDLPLPPTYTAEVKDSTKRVFSDRIMLCHLAGLFGSLLSQYGFSLGTLMRHDLVTVYSKQIIKAGAFCERITRLLIENKWLEKVPGL